MSMKLDRHARWIKLHTSSDAPSHWIQADVSLLEMDGRRDARVWIPGRSDPYDGRAVHTWGPRIEEPSE